MIAYYPQHLHAQLEKMKQEFSKSYGDAIKFSDEELEALVMKIVNCDASELKRYTFTLTRTELRCISSYIPANSYKIRRRNLLALFSKNNNFSYFETIYKGWQNNYKKCFFSDDIGILIFKFQNEIKSKYYLDANTILKWMSMNEADREVCRYVLEIIRTQPEETMENYLTSIGISKKSVLGKDVISRIYYVCGIEEYRELGDSNFVLMLNQLTIKDITDILSNFLEVMTTEDYQFFYKTSSLAKSHFSVPGSTRYSNTVGVMSERAKRNYTAWINYYWLIRMFGDDDRSKFWKNYISKYEGRYLAAHNALAMEFDSIVAIEFMEMGYSYLFDKDYYHKYVEIYANRDSTSEFKRFMNNDSQFILKKVHRGSWQYYIAAQLARKGIVRD